MSKEPRRIQGSEQPSGNVELVIRRTRDSATGVFEVAIKGERSTGSDDKTVVHTSPRAFAIKR